MAITSTIVLSATVAARDSGRRREPWQSGHVRSLWYASNFARRSSLSAFSIIRFTESSTPAKGLSSLRHGSTRSSSNPCMSLWRKSAGSFS